MTYSMFGYWIINLAYIKLCTACEIVTCTVPKTFDTAGIDDKYVVNQHTVGVNLLFENGQLVANVECTVQITVKRNSCCSRLSV
jgi:hypothetical protein